MESPIRYCTTADGVSIAYSSIGGGYPLVLTQGWITHLKVMLEHERTRHTFDEYASHFRVVRYDKRGVGLSDRNIEDFSVEARLLDLEAVVDDAGLDRFALYGFSEGGPVAIKYAVRHPRRVSHLVLHGTYAFGENVYTRGAIQPFANFVRANWGLASEAVTAAFNGPESDEDDRRFFTRMQKEGANRNDAAAIMLSIADVDVRSLLPELQVSTLIVHGRDDAVIPFENGRILARSIPRAQFLPFEGGHFLSGTAVERTIQAEIIGFILGTVPTQPAQQRPVGTFRTVLFTDIVGHTDMMQRLGDAKGRDVLREHERITRETLKVHGGSEVKTMGDGFMASFGSVTSAMECAIALQRAFATHTESMPEPLHVRVGLNAGEPIEEDGDLFGATVILASRIAAKAGAGEILIPEPVRHLLSGKTFVFSDRGEYEMKGFDDAVRLYEVKWRK